MRTAVLVVLVALAPLASAASSLAQEPPPPPPAAASTDAPAETAPAPSTEAAADGERTPAALESDAPAAAPSSSTSASGAVTEAPPARRIGEPVPLTQREPTLKALGFMVGLRYGLVGTGPTRFVDDVRFGITDNVELRTALLPYPSSLMVRARFGSQQSELGAFLLDAGLAHWDAGLRIVPDTGEPVVGMRFHVESGVGYARSFGDRVAVTAQAHYRYRLSLLPNDDQHAVAVDGHITYDLFDSLAVAAGLGIATTIVTPVRELSVSFVETDGPGMSHLLARDEGGTQSVTIPLSMTYGRVENFDVDLFCTPRVYPQLGVLFGAGIRLRLDPFTS